MARVTTSIHFDLKYLVGTTPPTIRIAFTEVGAGGTEEPSRATIVDAAAARIAAKYLLASPGLAGLIADCNAEISAEAAKVPDAPTLAARIAAADDAKMQLRATQAEKETLDDTLATMRAERDALIAEVAAKRAELVA